MIRQGWIDQGEAVAVVQQCELAGVSRATFYAHQAPDAVDELELLHSRLIDEAYTRHPFYGSRRMGVFLKKTGHIVNRKRVQRLMRLMGLAGMAPGPNTSRPHPQHKIYPYLLRGVAVVRPNQSLPPRKRGSGARTSPPLSRGQALHPAAQRFRLPGGDHRLVLASGTELADQ
jgi:putative transposase